MVKGTFKKKKKKNNIRNLKILLVGFRWKQGMDSF